MSAPTIPPAATPADDSDPRVADQHHAFEEDPAIDAAFAQLATTHPEACHKAEDYPEWTPGGES